MQISALSHSPFFETIFDERNELWFAGLCGLSLALGFGLSFWAAIPIGLTLSFYLLAYLLGGYFTLLDAWEALRAGKFDIDFLMLVAAVGAGILGEWAEGALLLFLFSLGHGLEHFAMNRARKSIAALSKLSPQSAILAETQREISIERLTLGDRILIRPNAQIPADGVIVQGQSSVNQAAITGESIPVEKHRYEGSMEYLPPLDRLSPEFRVFAGTLNGNGSLEVQVLRKTADSTLARLIQLVREAEQQKSPTQHLTDRIERYYVPAVLLLVLLLNFAFLVLEESFADSFYRAMAVLVAASPCALAISTPSAVLSGIGRAARSGVLIKGGGPLEALGTLQVLALDKTGTLTMGEPELNAIATYQGDETELLLTAMAVEQYSDHPLATAAVKAARKRLRKPIVLPKVKNIQSVTGKGVHAQIASQSVLIGKKEILQNEKLPQELEQQLAQLEQAGNTCMIIRLGERYLGILGFMDKSRPQAKAVLRQLSSLGIHRLLMLTGDNQAVANAVGHELGLTECWGNLLPEDKVSAIKRLRGENLTVGMLGDGVNDAPAMAISDVSIAMGAAGSDVALETADIALMGDQLERLPFVVGLGRKSKKIIRQNLLISLGMIGILVPLTMFGVASMGPAVIMHEGSTLLVVLNALRLLSYHD